MKNKVEIRIIALRRSGQHAIAHWIGSQLSGKIYHLNETHIKTPQRGVGGPLIRIPQCSFSEEEKDYYFYNVEDYDVSNVKRIQNHEELIGHSEKIIDILVIRDPFNNLASKYKWSPTYYGDYLSKEVVDKWKSYAREYLNITNYLEYKFPINYNCWVIDLQYRKNMSKKLELDFNDKMHRTQNSATLFKDSNYFERWKEFQNDPEFLKHFHDDELWELSNQIFEEIMPRAILGD